MLVDHFRYFGDAEFTRRFLPVCDAVLDCYKQRVDSIVGLVQCYKTDKYWAFVDWAEQWKPFAVPPAGKRTGFIAYESMLYAYTLQQLSNILPKLGRDGLVAEYQATSDTLIRSLKERCFDGNFFTDGFAAQADSNADYSQHSQIWAILCGAVTGVEATNLLEETMQKAEFTPPSIAMAFYALRALSAVDGNVYDSHFHDFGDPWHEQLSKNVITWVEDSVNERSECHAWGSAPIYEFISEVAGIKPGEPGWRTVAFRPRISLFQELDAKVPFPGIPGSQDQAIAHVHWSHRSDGKAKLSLSLATRSGSPVDIPIHVRLPSGWKGTVQSPYETEVTLISLGY